MPQPDESDQEYEVNDIETPGIHERQSQSERTTTNRQRSTGRSPQVPLSKENTEIKSKIDQTQNEMFQKNMASLKTLDQIDFDYKCKLHGGCQQCSRLSGNERYNYYKQDPGMFDFVVHYRALFKNKNKDSSHPTIRIQDLKDSFDS